MVLDQRPPRPRQRVEGEDRALFNVAQVNAAGHRFERLDAVRVGRVAGPPQLVARLAVGRVERRTREQVVELVEEDFLPGGPVFLSGVRVAVLQAGRERERFGLNEPALGAPVELLALAVRRVVPARVVLEFRPDDRQTRRRGRALDRGEELGDGAEVQFGQRRVLPLLDDPPYLLFRRAAAVVADAEKIGDAVSIHAVAAPDA